MIFWAKSAEEAPEVTEKPYKHRACGILGNDYE